MATAVVLMILSAIILFLYTKMLLKDQIEEELYSNKDRLEKLLIKDQSITGIPPIMMVEKVDHAEIIKLKDTLIYDPLQDEIELFEQLSETKIINGQHFRITVRAMVIESEDILFAIVFTFIGIILLTFFFLFYLNKSRNEKLWRPFFKNLDKLKTFSIKSNEPLNFEDSEILEFHELNNEMESLTVKIQKDYRNLKQFTEDVSHEMQTPLAILQVKIETLMNDVNISEEQFNNFSSFQVDISRLKQLNKKLIILAKIDNNQFSTTETISINKLLQESIANFVELAGVDIQLEASNEMNVIMDNSLAIILCNNLLSNAVKHNKDSNQIIVKIENSIMHITNSGDEALSHPDQLFDRFYKESKKSDSTGLGLSIVKKICNYYGFAPSYNFCENEHQHNFQIDFNPQVLNNF